MHALDVTAVEAFLSMFTTLVLCITILLIVVIVIAKNIVRNAVRVILSPLTRRNRK